MSLAQLRAIVQEVAPTLQHADMLDIVSAALAKLPTCGPQKAVRYALADWLRDQVDVPRPTEDIELRRELQKARRAVRAASAADLARWDKLLARLPEREREVAIRLAAGYSHRDIGAELGVNAGTVTRTVAKIRSRFADPCIWHPILDALYSLPDSKHARAARADLSEYRHPQTAQRTAVFVGKREATERKPIFTTWFVPFHETRQAPLAWYPGMPIRKWEPTTPSGLLAIAFGLGHEPTNYLRFGGSNHGKRSIDETAELTTRETAGLIRGERWTIERPNGDVLVRTPVRGTTQDRMIRGSL